MNPEQPHKLTRGQRFWRYPITRIFTYLLMLTAFALVLYWPMQGLLRLFHIPTKGHSEVEQLAAELYLALSAVGAYVLMIRGVEKRTLASAGLARDRIGAETSIGVLIGGGLVSLVIGLTMALGGCRLVGINPHFAWLLPVIVCLCIAVFEETIFRGYLFQTLETRWGSGVALLGSGAAFGLIHLLNPVAGVTPLEKLAGPVFIVFEASILMSAAYLLTRRLWLPIGIHWGWNFFESAVYGATDSGQKPNPTYTLTQAHFSGPFLFTGGPFGLEAGAVALIVGTAAGLLLLRRAIQRGQWKPRPQFSHFNIQHNQEVVS